MSRHIRWPHYRSDMGLSCDSVPVVDLSFGDSSVGGAIAAVLAVIVIGLLIAALLPVFLLIVEVLFVLLATLAFRRAWLVRAVSASPPEIREWRVAGMFRSRAAVREVADELRRGVVAAPEHGQVVV